MTLSLTNEEKIGIIDNHIKSIEFAIYAAQLDLIEAQAVSSPDASYVANCNSRITDGNAKKAALVEEKESLTVSE